VPVIDMRRSKKPLVGNIGIDEYGDPDKPEDWEFLSEISAYHGAAPESPIRRSCLRQAARMEHPRDVIALADHHHLGCRIG
jgi:hypothetical protein